MLKIRLFCAWEQLDFGNNFSISPSTSSTRMVESRKKVTFGVPYRDQVFAPAAPSQSAFSFCAVSGKSYGWSKFGKPFVIGAEQEFCCP